MSAGIRPRRARATRWTSRPAPVVRRLSLAYAPLAADVYWIRALQYYGGTKRRLASEPAMLMPPPALAADPAGQYPLLYPLLDLTTTLDPRFNVAYRFGSVFLAEPFPNGPGRPDLAVVLLEKGLRDRPDKWEYMQDIGFVHYWYRQDYRAAAAWFDKASRVPGAPWWLKSLAATTLAQGGDRRSSRQMWTAIRESAEVDWLKQDAERRLAPVARARRNRCACKPQVSDFLKRTGQRTTTWQALVRGRVVPGVMVDPTGTPYELTQDGAVAVVAALAVVAAACGAAGGSSAVGLMTDWPFLVAAAVFGAVVGSFLNVCIYRLPRGTSIVWPASACARCGRTLAWFENVPVVSYVALRGRCRTCGEPISPRYPIVETITAAMFALGWWYYGPGVLLASRLVLGCALIVLFEIDREHQILPHAITLPGIVVGFAFSFFTEPGWQASLEGLLLGGGILLAIGVRLLLPPARGRPGDGRFQDARDDRRVSRLAPDAGDADDGVAQRLGRRNIPDRDAARRHEVGAAIRDVSRASAPPPPPSSGPVSWIGI